jgi:hypothetical protein
MLDVGRNVQWVNRHRHFSWQVTRLRIRHKLASSTEEADIKMWHRFGGRASRTGPGVIRLLSRGGMRPGLMKQKSRKSNGKQMIGWEKKIEQLK